MSRKYLITEDEFESIRVEGRDLVATRDNGTPVNFGQVVPDISPEMQQMLDDTVEARDQAEVFSATMVELQDEAVATLVGTDGSETRTELNATIVDGVALDRASEGQAISKSALGTTKTVALTGHSLMYGQDTSASGTLPPINGATQARSSTPTTEAFKAQAAIVSPSAVTIVNQGYPGDRSSDSLDRWATGQSGDIEFFWLDTNDANNYAGRPGGTLTDAQTLANFRIMVLRAKSRGAEVVVVGGAPVSSLANSRKIFASAASDRAIAERYGATYVDVGELLSALPVGQPYFTDGVHLRPEAFSLVGARLAALVGPKGTNAPKVSPGRKITPKDNLHVGGENVARAASSSGTTVTLTAGQTLAIPVDVVSAVTPIVRFYRSGSGAGAIGGGKIRIGSNLGTSGVPDKIVKLTPGPEGSGGAVNFTWVPLPPMLSPGPDTLTVTCVSGEIHFDMVHFAATGPTLQGGGNLTDFGTLRNIPVQPRPVGGVVGRADAAWDSCVDLSSGVSLLAADGTTARSVHWAFDLTLGWSYSGLLLGEGVGSFAYGINNGYMILRHGSALLLRTWAGSSGVVDQSIAGVFSAATGLLRVALEVHHNTATNALDVYVDGALKGSIAAPIYKFLSAGLLAGVASGGAGYSAGSGYVYA